MKAHKQFAFRVSVVAIALFALALSGSALAQTIHIEMQDGQPVFVERPCDNEKGKVCNPKNSTNNINFVLRGAGPNTEIARIDISGAGPNEGANSGCYGSVVSGCGNVPAQYCTADHTPGQTWSIQVDFPNVCDQCSVACSGSACRLEVRNIANWSWNYEVYIDDGGTMKMADPIIVNRGVNGN